MKREEVLIRFNALPKEHRVTIIGNEIEQEIRWIEREKRDAIKAHAKKLEFYKLICEDLNLDFEEFSKLFEDKSLDKKLQNEFIFGRNLSSSFPSLILVNKKQKVNISIGYSSLEDVISRINKNLKSL